MIVSCVEIEHEHEVKRGALLSVVVELLNIVRTRNASELLVFTNTHLASLLIRKIDDNYLRNKRQFSLN